MTQDVKLPMPEQMFNDWMAALRSGNYNKGKGALKRRYDVNNLCHCGLGVLLETLNVPSYENDIGFSCAYWVWDLNVLGADAGYGSWARSINMHDDIVGRAVMLNDGTDLTFSEMADRLEELYDNMVKS